MKAAVSTKVYLVCPHCGSTDSRIDHLFKNLPQQFGPWDCSGCELGFKGTIHSPTDIDIEVVTERKVVPTTVLLVLPPQDKPVYFTVEGMHFPKNDGELGEHDQYFYEEHSCPTNWFKPTRVYIDGDADPHGLLGYVRTLRKHDTDEISAAIHLQDGHRPGSSDDHTQRKVIETLFPEVAKGFIPDGDDFDIERYIRELEGDYRPATITYIRRVNFLF